MQKIEELYSKFKDLGREMIRECSKYEWCSKGCPLLYKDSNENKRCKILDITAAIYEPSKWDILEEN